MSRVVVGVLWLMACACVPPRALQPGGGEPPRPDGEWVALDFHVVETGRPSMGTLLQLTLVMRDPARGRRAAEALFEQARRLEGLYSTYLPSSDLNRLSDAAGRGPQKVDPQLALILSRSLAYTHATDGAFDVTVGPLMDLWQEAAERGSAPNAAERAAVLLRVGPGGMKVNNHGPTVDLRRPGMRLDLGGIAKGWALDRMAQTLQSGGVKNALLDFGQSSVLALGRPPDATAWTVGLPGPDDELIPVALRAGRGFSVSGALGRYAEIGGVRYGHVIDPRTGDALTSNVQAAVVAPDATAAEAWSTALTVLGPAGLDLAEAEEGVEAHLLLEDGRVLTTPGWAEETRVESGS